MEMMRMDPYLAKWIRVIEEMKNDNTYKTAWGRGILECVSLNEYRIINDTCVVNQADIANKMIKYYWNQTFFFNLEQGHSPVILQIVDKMIKKYKREVKTTPVPWDQIENYFYENRSYYDRCVRDILRNAKTNVCPRFKNVGNKETLDIYEIDDDNKTLIFKKDDIKTIDEYAFVLSKLLNYKWAQLLERFNYAPKIANKVNAASDVKIRRASLKKFKKILLEAHHKHEIRDFYTDEVVEPADIHIDHVIPWSFVYTDDLWNLVVTSSKTNLSKNDRPPTRSDITRLNERNKQLVMWLDETKHTKHIKKIEYAIEHRLLDKLYVNMRG